MELCVLGSFSTSLPSTHTSVNADTYTQAIGLLSFRFRVIWNPYCKLNQASSRKKLWGGKCDCKIETNILILKREMGIVNHKLKKQINETKSKVTNQQDWLYLIWYHIVQASYCLNSPYHSFSHLIICCLIISELFPILFLYL